MLLAVGILAFPTTQTNAASCSSYVADSSYGNTGGYAYSHAVANCSSAVSATIYATIEDAGGGWLGYGSSSGYSYGFSTTYSGYFCATLAPGYYFNYTGAGGHLYPLWTC